MTDYEIECGEHKGKIAAGSVGAAWRKLTGKKISGFSPLARFRELPLNGRSPMMGRGIWRYVTPEALDKMR